MDKPIDAKTKRQTRLMKWGKWGGALLLLCLLSFALLRYASPKVEENSLYFGTVELGDMVQTLTASGTVVPAFEYTINAPVVTEIKRILRSNGALVEPGDVILELDQEYTALEYEKMRDELLLRANNLAKLRLQFDKELGDLELQNQIKGLQIHERDAQLQSQIRLEKVGGAAAEEIEAAKIQLQIMHLEKSMLELDLAYKRQVNQVEKQSLELEYGIQQKRLAELQRKLTETTVKAEEHGVITWINEDLGKTVQVGEPLVRIANLQQYRVEAVTSDRNLAWLKTGTPVRVRVNQQDLNGHISHTLPSIENNTVRFHVSLDDPAHEALRPNQRTEVFIVTGEKRDTRRLRMGPAITAGSSQDLFVVRDGMALKVRVEKGLNNPDYVEILDPLQPGDRVILSDTRKFDHLSQFKLQ